MFRDIFSRAFLAAAGPRELDISASTTSKPAYNMYHLPAIDDEEPAAPGFRYRSQDLVESIRHAQIMACRGTLARRPMEMRAHAVHSALINLLEYQREHPVRVLQELRRGWGLRYPRPRLDPTPHDYSTNRRLKIGYLSAELHHHSAAYSAAGVLWHHDHDKFETFVYSLDRSDDEIAQGFRKFSDHWRGLPFRGHKDLARTIQADNIDILVDLSGHSACGITQIALTMKPAPLIVQAIGAANGTEVEEVDYLFGNSRQVTDADLRFYSPKFMDLPAPLPYQPMPYAPKAAPYPSVKNGFITFGYFGRILKLDDKHIALWCRVLREMPTARMIFKDKVFKERAFVDAWLERFKFYGVEPDRLELRSQSTHIEHLAAHNDVDICLDSLPNGGGMTTIEALWMSRAVLTLEEPRPQGRLAAMILHGAGLDQFIAQTEDEFVALCKTAPLAYGLRAHVAKSRMVSGAAHDYENAYTEIWGEFCTPKFSAQAVRDVREWSASLKSMG